MAIENTITFKRTVSSGDNFIIRPDAEWRSLMDEASVLINCITENLRSRAVDHGNRNENQAEEYFSLVYLSEMAKAALDSAHTIMLNQRSDSNV